NLSVAPFFVTIDPLAVSMIPGQSQTFHVTVAHNPDTDFNEASHLSLADPPPGMTATFDHTHFAAPGDGTATMTLNLSGDIFPQTYRGVTAIGTADAGPGEGAA